MRGIIPAPAETVANVLRGARSDGETPAYIANRGNPESTAMV